MSDDQNAISQTTEQRPAIIVQAIAKLGAASDLIDCSYGSLEGVSGCGDVQLWLTDASGFLERAISELKGL